MKTIVQLSALIGTLLVCAGVRAQTLTWDNGAATGIWDTGTNANWSGSTWAANDNAIFGVSGIGTVTIAGPVAANSVTFNNAGYTIAGGTLTLTGSKTITANANATIAAPLSGGLTYAGTGTLTLSGTSSLGGGATLNGGALYLTGQLYTSFSGGPVTVNANATLEMNGWGYPVDGLDQLTAFASGLVVNGGTIKMSGNAPNYWVGRGFTIGAAGATLAVDSGITWNVGSAYYTAYDLALTNNTSLTLAGAGTGVMDMPVIGTGSVTMNGAGTWTLKPQSSTSTGIGTNTYTGVTTVNSGTLQAGNVAAFSSSSAVTLANVAGATLALNGNNNTISSLVGGGTTGGNVTLGNATLTMGGDNTSTTFGGAISGGNIVKVGTGTLTLSGTGSLGGNATLNGGALYITGQLYTGGSGGWSPSIRMPRSK